MSMCMYDSFYNVTGHCHSGHSLSLSLAAAVWLLAVLRLYSTPPPPPSRPPCASAPNMSVCVLCGSPVWPSPPVVGPLWGPPLCVGPLFGSPVWVPCVGPLCVGPLCGSPVWVPCVGPSALAMRHVASTRVISPARSHASALNTHFPLHLPPPQTMTSTATNTRQLADSIVTRCQPVKQ